MGAMAYLKHAKIARPLAALFCIFAAPAAARVPPPPPPSGVVVHLFGPDSLSSHILPAGPGGQAGGPQNSLGGQPYVEPSWGAVAHQIFVTGDPAQEGQAALAKGKMGGN